MLTKAILFCFLLTTLVCCHSSLKDSLPEIYSNGSKIDYYVGGKGDTVLLFVHGWCINKSYWDAQVEFFKSKYKVVTLDLPGHGKSGNERDDWSIEQFGTDVVTLIDVLDLNAIVLIGHSMGGNTILEAANKRPQKVIGFVGIDNFKDLGAAYTVEQMKEMHTFISSVRQDYSTVMKSFAEGMLFAESTSSDIRQRVMTDILETPPKISVDILESLLSTNLKERELMKKLHLPVHLVNSDVPPTNELQLKKYCSFGYEIHSMGVTGHYPMLEKPELFNSILQTIINKL